MARRITGLLAAALIAVALAGCDRVPQTRSAEASLPPGVEALAYLPADAQVVALVDTDVDSRQWRSARSAARRAGVEGRLLAGVDRLRDAGVDTGGGRELLGNLLAWAPSDGVAALVVSDAALLARLVDEHLRSGALRDAGVHRGARLLAADGLVLAARDGVVVAGSSERTVRRALDRRAAGEGYDVERFKRALAGLPVESLVRVAVDLRSLTEEHAGAWRAAPFADALGSAGSALRSEGRATVVDARVDLEDDLLARDSPLPRGTRVAPPRLRARAVHVALADLPHMLGAAYRAAFATHPAATARAELASILVRRRQRIDPAHDLVAALAGPATLQLARGDVLLRAPVARPRRAARAIRRLAERLPRVLGALGVGHVVVRPLARLRAVVRRTDVLALFGLRDGNLVVSSGSPRALLRAASTDAQDGDDRLDASLALRAGPQALDRLLGVRASARGHVRATPGGLRGTLRLR